MSPIVTTFLFEAANFLVLAAALGWFFFKPVRQALVDRRAQFESDNQRAADMLAEAKKVQREADQGRDRLQEELQQMRASELEAAHQQAEQIIAEARSVAEREREMSRRRAASMSETQRDILAEASAVAAAETVGRLLEQINGPQLQAALIESACQQLHTLQQEQLAPVKVESSRPLSSEQQSALKEALGPAAETADFQAVGGLGDGVRILTASGLVDATVKGLVHFAGQSLTKEMKSKANHHNPLRKSNDG